MRVDLASLVSNAVTVRAAARGARLLPMLKADAYGFGAVPVARALEGSPAADPWGFGVAGVGEGAALRAAGIRRPILVFTPARSEAQEAFRAHDLRAALDDPAVIAGWTLPYHLDVDTGMGRSGVRWDDPRLAQCRTAKLEGAFTHFHSAEDDPGSVELQWSRFETALRALGERPRLVHAANSAAVWRLEQRLDLIRPGLFLYGVRPAPHVPAPRPVASLYARVVSVRRICAGEGVSYGVEWRAPRDTTIATVGLGYADGVPRATQGKLVVLIGGRRYPVVGRITMDMVMVDAGPDGTVRTGDVATFVGRDSGEEITWDDVAGWAGTNVYEVICRVNPRVERIYVAST
jgi:alanine racemase